jgi:hypothetical protein
MFTRNKLALPAAAIAQTIAAQITRKSELLTAAAVCGLLLCGNARGQDQPGAMRISAATTDQGTPAPAPEAAPVGRVGLGHGEACDGAACNGSCGPASSHCGIWHTGLCGGPDHGYGCRFLDYHCYSMAYPVNPWYYDPRDTRVYAAAGFGAPMTIPLAPTVQTQVNYSWGIPASRITPISRVAYQPGAMMGAMAPLAAPYGAPAAPVPPMMPTAAPR